MPHLCCRKRSAFTLVEMLVVLAIIGMVAAMSLPMILPMMRRKSIDQATEQVKSSLLFARSRAIQTQRMVNVTLLTTERAIIVTDYDVIRGSRTEPFVCAHWLGNYSSADARFDALSAAAVPNGSTTVVYLPEGCQFDMTHLNPTQLAQGVLPPAVAAYDVMPQRAWTWLFLPSGSVWTLPPNATNTESTWQKTTFSISDKPAGPIVVGPEQKTVYRIVQIIVYAMTGQTVSNECEVRQ